MKKIKEILKNIITKELILYGVFGVLTTLVNLVVFYILNTTLKWNENLANIIAIICAVLFAYVTNKDMVFHSTAKTSKDKILEFIRFVAGRSFTMVIEFLGGYILFKLPIPKMIVKIVISVVVIILNFFISKFFAFKSKKKNEK